MQNRYPLNQWQEITGSCDTQLFLGCTDEVTAKVISDRTGVVTVGVSSEAKQLNTWRVSNYTPEYRETRSTGRRNLLTPDEVLRFPLDDALVILRGQKVLRVQKYDFSEHPEAKYLRTTKARDYVPEWRSIMIKETEDREQRKKDREENKSKKQNTAEPPTVQPSEFSEPDKSEGFYIDTEPKSLPGKERENEPDISANIESDVNSQPNEGNSEQADKDAAEKEFGRDQEETPTDANTKEKEAYRIVDKDRFMI